MHVSIFRDPRVAVFLLLPSLVATNHKGLYHILPYQITTCIKENAKLAGCMFWFLYGIY